MTKEAYDAHQAKYGRAVVLGSGGEVKRGKGLEPKLDTPKPKKKWDYESRLAQQLEDAGIGGFYVDVEYLPERKLRADILFPPRAWSIDCPRFGGLVVEVQGAAHRIKGKWKADILKAQDTMLAGFRLLPIGTDQVRSGDAVGIIRKALAQTEAR